MPELLLELFSEEIPARMQARGVVDLSRLVGEALAGLSPAQLRTFHGPRRIALTAEVANGVAESHGIERGPRVTAPEQALAGFLRKHGATRDQVTREGDYWVLHKLSPGRDAATLIAAALPPLLRRFPWPKSMRWGGTSAFGWVRPLRRILCVLDGEVVPFDLRDGADDGHGLVAGNETEGHRFLAPGPVAVSGLDDWREKLHERRVILDAEERKRIIRNGIAALAEERRLDVVDDPGLLDEVAGLVEWPVPLLGQVDDAFMDLPPEVMQVSMRVNQRYFALRNPDGSPAPFFGFAANVAAPDGGAAIVAGNERVLRARFADARHFWDLDRKVPLESRVPALDGITFHAKLGSQGDRVRRLVRLAGIIAPLIGGDSGTAEYAARLAKADLTTGMVGEFPELQGVMGRYYAQRDGEPPEVADAIRDHYKPKGPSDSVPDHPVSIAVAFADKLDLLVTFFAIGEQPTGSGDPYALRRAALGILRILLNIGLRLRLASLIELASKTLPKPPSIDELLVFLTERMRVQLRSDGMRHDVLDAVFHPNAGNDFYRLQQLANTINILLQQPPGRALVTAYKRAANILRIEDRIDGPHSGDPDPGLFTQPEERELYRIVTIAEKNLMDALTKERETLVFVILGTLCQPVDAFFDSVTVNASEPELRRNRLRLLARLRNAMNHVADFSKIEG